MIKNIVFDMGNVLMRWNPEEFVLRFFENAQDARQVCERMFGGAEWQGLDAGTIEEDAALAGILADLPARLHPQATALFDGWQEHFLPISEMNELALELKSNGLNLYLLSNASTRFADYACNIPALTAFDGQIVSAFYRQVKPNRDIYETLFTSFGLTPEECFFIDDLSANIEAARAAGMPGHIFDGDVNKLRAAMREYDIAI